jgi:hypothetical protein
LLLKPPSATPDFKQQLKNIRSALTAPAHYDKFKVDGPLDEFSDRSVTVSLIMPLKDVLESARSRAARMRRKKSK